ncbi:MAG: hypothetical protein EOS05_31475 [Mesorhizobium sp.]|nr:hypothetical protein EOC06_26635 [Mesorhizobium sp. M7A.F.Ca.MR.362.00.0.0]RWN87827.1 MAG: hypothetical protein EOS05_31475 [Mesorhizobium sp.]
MRFRYSRTKSTLRSGSRRLPFSARPDPNPGALFGTGCSRIVRNGKYCHDIIFPIDMIWCVPHR